MSAGTSARMWVAETGTGTRRIGIGYGEVIERVLDPELQVSHAVDLAFRCLNRRDRTVLEVRRYLEGKRVEPAAIDEAINHLLQQGYLDDARYAQRFAEDKRRLDHWGADRIARRLAANGVAREHVDRALSAASREDELHGALTLLRRRFPHPPETLRDRRRALDALLRRGHDPEVAHDALRAHARPDPI